MLNCSFGESSEDSSLSISASSCACNESSSNHLGSNMQFIVKRRYSSCFHILGLPRANT